MIIRNILNLGKTEEEINAKIKNKANDAIKKERRSKFFVNLLYFVAFSIVLISLLALLPLSYITIDGVRTLQNLIEEIIKFIFWGEFEKAFLLLLKDLGDILTAFTRPMVLAVMYAGLKTMRLNRAVTIKFIPHFKPDPTFFTEIKTEEYLYSTKKQLTDEYTTDFLIWLGFWFVIWKLLLITNLLNPEQIIKVDVEKFSYVNVVKEQFSYNVLIGIITLVIYLWFASGWHIQIRSLVKSESRIVEVRPFYYDAISAVYEETVPKQEDVSEPVVPLGAPEETVSVVTGVSGTPSIRKRNRRRR